MGQRNVEISRIMMTLVKLPISHPLSGRAESAIKMSHWCRDRGLTQGVDFDWAFMSERKEVHFRFYGDSQSFASMFSLQWI